MKRIRRYEQIRNIGGCSACGERFTEGRPSEQFATLCGDMIAVHSECAGELRIAQNVLVTNWTERREMRREAVERGPQSHEDVVSRLFALHPDIREACDRRAEERVAAFLKRSKTALQDIENKQDIEAKSPIRENVRVGAFGGQIA